MSQRADATPTLGSDRPLSGSSRRLPAAWDVPGPPLHSDEEYLITSRRNNGNDISGCVDVAEAGYRTSDTVVRLRKKRRLNADNTPARHDGLRACAHTPGDNRPSGLLHYAECDEVGRAHRSQSLAIPDARRDVSQDPPRAQQSPQTVQVSEAAPYDTNSSGSSRGRRKDSQLRRLETSGLRSMQHSTQSSVVIGSDASRSTSTALRDSPTVARVTSPGLSPSATNCAVVALDKLGDAANTPRAEPRDVATSSVASDSSLRRASSAGQLSGQTPAYIRDLYGTPPAPTAPIASSAHATIRPHTVVSTRTRPSRGPAPLELLFEGKEVAPGAGPSGPRKSSAFSEKRAVTYSIALVAAEFGADVLDVKKLEAARAEEAKRYSVWETTARECLRSHPTVKPGVGAGHGLEVSSSVVDQQGEPGLSYHDIEQTELELLFSPPASPRSPARSTSSWQSDSLSRSTSPELFVGVQTSSARKPQLSPKTSPSASLSLQASPAREANTGKSRRYTKSPRTADAVSDCAPLSAVQDLALRRLDPLTDTSPGRDSAANESHEGQQTSAKPRNQLAQRKPRKPVVGSTRGSRRMKQRKRSKPWSTLEPENAWWTRHLTEERREASMQVPRTWVGPEQPELRNMSPGDSIADAALELHVREIVLPDEAVPKMPPDRRECWADLHVALSCMRESSDILLGEQRVLLRLVPDRADSTFAGLRKLRPEDRRPFEFEVDLPALAREESILYLSLSIAIGNSTLRVQQMVTAADPFPPVAAHLPFHPTAPASAVSVPCGPSKARPAATQTGPGLSVLLAAAALPRLAPTSPTSNSALLSTRLERLAIFREMPSGVWLPDAVAVRAPGRASDVTWTMPELEGGGDRAGYDFLTKEPYVTGEPVRLFAHDTVETTRGLLWNKDEEISRSSMTPEEKLVARMQARWCLVNPYPPTVYHRERACWVHYAPVLSHFKLRSTLALHLVRHLLAHRLITQPQLRAIVHAVDAEIERIVRGEREAYDVWCRRSAGEKPPR